MKNCMREEDEICSCSYCIVVLSMSAELGSFFFSFFNIYRVAGGGRQLNFLVVVSST